jgi:hypothetical protein
MNNMGREIMAALKRFQVGSDGDGVTVGGALVVSGATTANTFTASGPSVISVDSASDALRITQVGAGNALVVEDEANPDSTPFVIDANGDVVIGNLSSVTPTASATRLSVNATGAVHGISSFTWRATGTATVNGGISIARSGSSTVGTNTALIDGNEIGEVGWFGADGTGFVKAAAIECNVDGTPGTNDMPGRLVFSTTADGASTPSEAARITNSGAVLVGTTSTPTKAGSGYVVAENGLIIGAVNNAGLNQVYAGAFGTVTATTGTVVFNFKMASPSSSARSAFVKLSVTTRNNNNTPSNHPAAEYWFQLHNTTGGVVSLNGATSIFEYTYVYATHFAFANLGSGESTVTLTNPIGISIVGGVYKVEILTQFGAYYLDTVTVT